MRAMFFLVLLLAITPAPAEAQRAKRCTGEAPDSTLMAGTPVYRDCDVDRPVKRRGAEPRLNMSPASMGALPREGCSYVELEMIVDTAGQVEPTSLRVRRSDSRELEDAVRESVNSLRFEPALKDGKPVRQVWVYKRSIGVVVRVSGQGGFSSAPPPRCS